MVFKSRIDRTYLLLSGLIILMCLGTVAAIWWDQSQVLGFNLWASILLVAIAGLVVWSYSETNYTLDETELKYKSGIISGKIPIETIQKLDVNKTMWSGLKLATATKGIIIYYKNGYEIYISPEDNEEFVKELLKIKPEIKVNRY